MAKRPHLSVLDYDAAGLKTLKQIAADQNISIATNPGYTDFTLAAGMETPAVEMQVHYVRKLAEIAQALNAKMIRIFTGYTTQPEAYTRDWETCVKAVR